MKVFVYFNLNKKVWSVRALEGENKGKVIAHLQELALSNCFFKVSEISRQKVLRERQKNVHAGVVGTLNKACLKSIWRKAAGVQIGYNPYKGPTFYEKETDAPIFTAKKVVFRADRKVFAFR